jgi:hypothetical protein
MNAKRYGWFHGVVLAVLAACPSTRAADAWNFGVSPRGQPELSIALGLVTRDLLFGPITLRHDLVFDGTRYWSRIILPELQSHLIARDASEYEWSRIGGTMVVLRADHDVPNGNRVWQLSRESDGAYVVRSTDGAERFRYRHCRLESAEVGPSAYRFDSAENQVVATRQSPSARTLFSVDLRPDGLIGRLAVGGKTYSFDYNDAQQMTACWIEPAHEPLAFFAYRDGLLAHVDTHGRQANFQWGTPDFREYFRLPTPLAPIVTDDGTYAYCAAMDKSGLTISFRSRDRNHAGSWRVDSQTHQLEIRTEPAHP